MHHNGWILPDVTKRPSVCEEVPRENPADFREHRRQFIRRRLLDSPLRKPVKARFASVLSQCIDFSKPITIGGKYCTEDDPFHSLDDYDSLFSNSDGEDISDGGQSDAGSAASSKKGKDKDPDRSKIEQKELLGGTGPNQLNKNRNAGGNAADNRM